MKPSHLAALMLAGLGLGGMSSAAVAATGIHQPQNAKAPAHPKASSSHIFEQLIRGGLRSGNLPGSLGRKLNQRQLRLNRRRAHAAGSKKAFQ